MPISNVDSLGFTLVMDIIFKVSIINIIVADTNFDFLDKLCLILFGKPSLSTRSIYSCHHESWSKITLNQLNMI